MSGGPAIAVVVVAHDSAGDLPSTLGALGGQLRDGDEVVVVDNASTDGSPAVARSALPGATVVETGVNLGFAPGCHVGVNASSAPLVLLLNPDCAPAPGCLDALRAVAADRPDWDVWQALVTLPGGDTVNTAGNVVHFLGFGWAGRLDEPVAAIDPEPAEAGFASGAALVIRREAWDRAGGFDERYFMYGEDLDLSLRVRLAGGGVGVVPRARVEHVYEFTKGDYKWFYLERNRLWTVLAVYPGPLLALLAPALLVFEVALLLAAWRGGWLGPKLRAQGAVVRELRHIADRRRAIQATARIAPRAFAEHLVASLDSPNLAAANAIPGAGLLLRLYWRAVLAVLR